MPEGPSGENPEQHGGAAELKITIPDPREVPAGTLVAGDRKFAPTDPNAQQKAAESQAREALAAAAPPATETERSDAARLRALGNAGAASSGPEASPLQVDGRDDPEQPGGAVSPGTLTELAGRQPRIEQPRGTIYQGGMIPEAEASTVRMSAASAPGPAAETAAGPGAATRKIGPVYQGIRRLPDEVPPPSATTYQGDLVEAQGTVYKSTAREAVTAAPREAAPTPPEIVLRDAVPGAPGQPDQAPARRTPVGERLRRIWPFGKGKNPS